MSKIYFVKEKDNSIIIDITVGENDYTQNQGVIAYGYGQQTVDMKQQIGDISNKNITINSYSGYVLSILSTTDNLGTDTKDFVTSLHLVFPPEANNLFKDSGDIVSTVTITNLHSNVTKICSCNGAALIKENQVGISYSENEIYYCYFSFQETSNINTYSYLISPEEKDMQISLKLEFTL